MAKSTKNYNGKITYDKYSNMRDYIHDLYLYLTGSRRDGSTSNSTNDRNRYRLRAIIDNQYFQEKNDAKGKSVTFKTSLYSGSRNYLASTYQGKSLIKGDYKLFIILQMILQTPNLIRSEYQKQPLAEYSMDARTFNKYLEILCDLGLVIKLKTTKAYTYQPAKNILTDFTPTELQRLYDISVLYTNQCLLTVPGFYLTQTIANYMKYTYGPSALKQHRFWQLRLNNFARTVNDEIIYALLQAIDANKLVEINLNQQSLAKKISPTTILTEYPYHRQYICSAGINYKIDNIRKLVIKKETQQQPLPALSHGKPFKVHFHLAEEHDERKKLYILARIKREGGWLQLEYLPNGDIIGTAQVQDALYYLPWLRSFHKYAQLIEPNCSITTKLEADRKEAMKNYGLI